MRSLLLPLLLAAVPMALGANVPAVAPAVAPPVAPAVAVPVAPSPWPDGRYNQMVEQSPFALATAPETPVDEHSFADGWKLKGIAKLRDLNGAEEYFVTIKSADLKDVYSFIGNKENKGVSVVTVNYSDHMGKSTVVLRKGAETAKIEYDGADILGAPPAPTQTTPRQLGVPGQGIRGNTAGGGRNPLVQPTPYGLKNPIPRPNIVRPTAGPVAATRRIRSPNQQPQPQPQ